MKNWISLLFLFSIPALASNRDASNLKMLRAIHEYGKLMGQEVSGLTCFERITRLSGGVSQWCGGGICVPIQMDPQRREGAPIDIAVCEFSVGGVSGCSGGRSGMVHCPGNNGSVIGVPLETKKLMSQAEWVNWDLKRHPPQVASVSSRGSYVRSLGVCSSSHGGRCHTQIVPGYMGFTKAVCICN